MPPLPLPPLPGAAGAPSTSGPPSHGGSPAGEGNQSGTEQLGWCISVSPVVLLIAVLIYAAADHFPKGTTFGSVTAVGIAAAAAALMSGVFVGFLFGLPQALNQTKPKGFLTTNTSLDQITDWLTKILVGLGLVQLGKVGHGVSRLASSLAPGLGNGPGAEAFATALLIYAAADGFLIGYLWARIVLSARFNAAAKALAKEDIEQYDLTLAEAPSPLPTKPQLVAETVQAARPPDPATGQLVAPDA